MSKGCRWLGGCGGLALVTTVLGLGAIALCVGLPVGFWQYTTWQYCWFPPQDPTIEVVASACQNPDLHSVY